MPLCCLVFDIRILITHLVSSNSSYVVMNENSIYYRETMSSFDLKQSNRISDSQFYFIFDLTWLTKSAIEKVKMKFTK
jgi:hypothetical protein